MSRTKTIYFLSAFVLIIGCFALNKSYSLFTQNIESDPITATVPKLDVSLSMTSITVEAGKEYLIKQTVTNNSVVPVNFGITSEQSANIKIAKHDSIPNNTTYGIKGDTDTSLAKESSKDIYLIVSNIDGTSDLTVNFTLNKNYTTITTTSTYLSNITNEEDVVLESEDSSGLPYSDEPNTLKYIIIANYVKDNNTDDIKSLLANTNKIFYPINASYTFESPISFSEVSKSDEKKLLKTEDDYGTSYYYRGAVDNNYVNFAGFTWRIVRINGDGSVRLILDGTLDKVNSCTDTTICSNIAYNSAGDNAKVGYMSGFSKGVINKCIMKDDMTGEYTVDNSDLYTTKEACETQMGRWAGTAYETTQINISDSTIKTKIDAFYVEFLKSSSSYLSDSIFCGDKTLASALEDGSTNGKGYGLEVTSYAANERLIYNKAIPTLKCASNSLNNYSRYTVEEQMINGVSTNGDLKYPIALLSADELVFAGAYKDKLNNSFYLSSAFNNSLAHFWWWTMTPLSVTSESNNYVFIASHAMIVSSIASLGISHDQGVRPVINLRSDVLWASGNGTSERPYTVSLPSNQNTVTFTLTSGSNVTEEYTVANGTTFNDFINNNPSVPFRILNGYPKYDTFIQYKVRTECINDLSGSIAKKDTIIESGNYTCVSSGEPEL